MCGICGIVDYEGQAADFADRLPGMVRTLQHRGPDESGTWADGCAGLGHARLSIIDLSGGKQPLSNEDGTVWITYNGEVYNFPEVREQLAARGHQFRTQTDTEVIVHLYEEDGIECVDRLRGMFAFGIWDARKRTMYLVRDRLGIKPLYYMVLNGRLIFGSEIKAILAHGGVPRAVREDALSDYLTFLYVPAPKSMFRGIFKLEPGHWLRFDSHGLRVQQYWDLEPAEPLATGRKAIERRLVEELAESVRIRLVSDVPLGAFLSGGVDSSSVVAMMSKAGQDPLITASIGFEEREYNELPYARRVAERYETQHHEEIVLPEATSVVDKLAWHYDEPFADYSSIPTHYVSKIARKHVTVALSGDGGDENFAGYSRYRWDLTERRIRRFIPSLLRRWVLGPVAKIYPNPSWLPKQLRAKATLENIATDRLSAYIQSCGMLSEQGKSALLAKDVAHCLKGYRSCDIIREHMDRFEGNGLDQLLYAEIKTYLVDDLLTKVDRASMAVSLEVRVPFLDHTFVEYARRIPAAMKIEKREGKAILKSAMRGYLDEDILYRPKQGFTPPITKWLRGELREMAADLLFGRDVAYGQYLQQSVIEEACRQHQSGIRNNVALLWATLVFELWARKFL